MEQSSGNVFGFAPRIAHCVSCVSSGKTANGSTYGTCDTGTLSCRIVHVLAEVTRSTCLYHPACNRGNGEVADDSRVGRGHYCPFPL